MLHFDVEYKVLSLFARNKVLVVTEIFGMVQSFRGAADNTKEKLSMKNKNKHKEMKTTEEFLCTHKGTQKGPINSCFYNLVPRVLSPTFQGARKEESWEGGCCF